MRACEFITEDRRKGKVPRSANSASKGIYRMRDDGGYDRANHLNRVMMAAACHDGKNTNAVKQMDPASWVEKYNTAHPYTKEESNMIQGALKTVGAESDHTVSDSRSIELPEVNRASPVTGFKGYKRK